MTLQSERIPGVLWLVQQLHALNEIPYTRRDRIADAVNALNQELDGTHLKVRWNTDAEIWTYVETMPGSTMSQKIAAIWLAVGEQTQDVARITELVQDFNAHEEYRYMVSIVESPSTGRTEIIPMEK